MQYGYDLHGPRLHLLIHLWIEDGIEALQEVTATELAVEGNLARVRAILNQFQCKQLHLGVAQQHQPLANDLDGHLGYIRALVD
jgi:hypothetical protein